jgi:tetratricopeptide (TPR) repeat protein
MHERSQALIRMGMNGEAMEEVQKALQIAPDDYDLLETYWELRFKRDEKSADELRGLEAANPDNPLYPRLLSVLLPKPVDRLDAARRAARLAPGEPTVYLAMGNAFRALGRPDSAEVFYSKAVELDSERYDASLSLAALIADRGDRKKAEEIYRTVIERSHDPDTHDTAVDRLISLYWDAGDTTQVLKLAKDAQSSVRDPWVLNDIAWGIAEARADIPLAEQIAHQAIGGMNAAWLETAYPGVDKDWAESTSRRYQAYLYETLGFVYRQAGNTEQAIVALEEAVRLAPYVDSDIETELASAYRDAGRLDDAIGSLLDILAVSMNDEAMARLDTIYTEAHGDTTGLQALIAERRSRQVEPAADFRMPTLTGDTVSLSDYRGKVILLDFWFPT